MNDIDQLHDPSDHPMSVDQKLILTMGEVDLLTEQYIRQQMGDEQYDAHVEKMQTDSQFEQITRGIAPKFEARVAKRARQIARTLVAPGEGITSRVDKRAEDMAFEEELVQDLEPEVKDYDEAFDYAGEVVAKSIEDDLVADYPGIKLTRAQDSMLNFELKARDGRTLRIVVTTEEEKLITSVNYQEYIEIDGKIHLEQEPVDLEMSDGNIEGIKLSRFKSDVLVALQVGIDRLRLLKEASKPVEE